MAAIPRFTGTALAETLHSLAKAWKIALSLALGNPTTDNNCPAYTSHRLNVHKLSQHLSRSSSPATAHRGYDISLIAVNELLSAATVPAGRPYTLLTWQGQLSST